MKNEMSEVITDAFMSSQESDQEDGKLVYVVKTDPWEREELKKRKRNPGQDSHKETNPSTGGGSEMSLKGRCSVLA